MFSDSSFQAGANHLVLDKFRQGTLLYNVAEQGHDHVIPAIIRLNGDVNKATCTGATPLYIACCNGHDACAKALMDAACFIAAQQGHAHVIAVLKELNADVKIAELKAKGGSTPLHAAALAGHTECVKELVSAGADIFAVNAKGQTAWQIASDDVAQLLQQLQLLREGSARSASGGV